VRRFVPEPARLPAPAIHQPWSAAPLEFKSAGIGLGNTWSCADRRSHGSARARASSLFEAARRLRKMASL